MRFLVSNLITYLTHNAFCLQKVIFIFIRCFLKLVLILTPHVGDAILGTYPICGLDCNFITILSKYQQLIDASCLYSEHCVLMQLFFSGMDL